MTSTTHLGTAATSQHRGDLSNGSSGPKQTWSSVPPALLQPPSAAQQPVSEPPQPTSNGRTQPVSAVLPQQQATAQTQPARLPSSNGALHPPIAKTPAQQGTTAVQPSTTAPVQPERLTNGAESVPVSPLKVKHPMPCNLLLGLEQTLHKKPLLCHACTCVTCECGPGACQRQGRCARA